MEQRSCASKRSNRKSKFSRKILFMRCPNRKAKSIVRPKSCHHSIKPLSLPLKKWHQFIRHVEPESSSRHSRNLGGGTWLIFFHGRKCADLIKKSSTRIEHATCGRQKKNITNPSRPRFAFQIQLTNTLTRRILKRESNRLGNTWYFSWFSTTSKNEISSILLQNTTPVRIQP
jgi:hypothetical protein